VKGNRVPGGLDEVLLRQVGRGDRAAFDELYRRNALIALFAWQAGDAIMDRSYFSSEQARIPVLAYASTVYLAAPRHPGGPAAVWAWPMQPWNVLAAAITAAVLSLLAVTVHAAVDVRPTSDQAA
jgi:hypothetical protein